RDPRRGVGKWPDRLSGRQPAGVAGVHDPGALRRGPCHLRRPVPGAALPPSGRWLASPRKHSRVAPRRLLLLSIIPNDGVFPFIRIAGFLRGLPLPSGAPPGDHWRSEQGRSEGGTPVTDAQTWSSDLNLSDNAFWAQSPERRSAAYKTLRALE